MKELLLFFILFPYLVFSQFQIGSDIIGEDPVSMMGYAVDISSDGNIIAIGAPLNDGNGFDSGHVRIYENINSAWTQIGNDIDGENQGEESGKGLSLSGDGSIIAIGSPRNSENGTFSGQVRVFENINGVWTQLGQDLEGDSPGEKFGERVKISSDGSTLAISYDYYKLKIFENINNSWVQKGQELDHGYISDTFGYHIDLSYGGNIVAVGTHGFINGNAGRVHIYEYVNGSWIQIGQDIDGLNDNDYFGAGLSLSENGDILAVSAYFNDEGALNSGQVRVFENINNTWVQIGQSLNGEGSNDNSGVGISLSSDGSILAIGAPNNDGGGGLSGHVRVFQYNGNDWIQRGTDIDGNQGDQLGNSVALSHDGSKLIAGAFTAGLNNSSGLARVYELDAVLSVGEQIFNRFSISPNPVNTQFVIQLENSVELKKVAIYNNLGQLVLTSHESIIDTTELISGIYIVEIETNEGRGSKKLIIE